MAENSDKKMCFDATDELQRYRTILRTIWNSYLWDDPELRDWDMVDHFNRVRPFLLEHLVIEKLRRQLDASADCPITILIVPAVPTQDFRIGASIRISETLERQSGRDWSQAPGYIHKTDMVLRFKDYFDWGQCSYRDLQYFLVEIWQSEVYPDLIGHEALIEVQSSAVLVFAGERTADEVRAAVAQFWPGA